MIPYIHGEYKLWAIILIILWAQVIISYILNNVVRTRYDLVYPWRVQVMISSYILNNVKSTSFHLVYS